MKPATVQWLLSLFLLALVSCGGDTSVSIRFSSGTIVDDASCSGASGSFPLEQQGGLVVIVIVTDDTTIVHASSGRPARCADLTAGTHASVQGADDDGGIRADQIAISSS
jgi:hypothetical protein